MLEYPFLILRFTIAPQQQDECTDDAFWVIARQADGSTTAAAVTYI